MLNPPKSAKERKFPLALISSGRFNPPKTEDLKRGIILELNPKFNVLNTDFQVTQHFTSIYWLIQESIRLSRFHSFSSEECWSPQTLEIITYDAFGVYMFLMDII